MGIVELVFLAVGLSMDAFAVAVCKGLSMKKSSLAASLTVGLYFGVFQAGMPLLGYFLGRPFSGFIMSYDHWIAFGLLGLIGFNMVRESMKDEDEQTLDSSLSLSAMLPMAVATSIDAMAVGISFAFLEVSIVPAVTLIGVTTLLLSMVGVKIGNVFGLKYKSKAELAGGFVLIFLGARILLEHLLV